MKRIVSLVFVLALCLGMLAGCGGSDVAPASNAAAESAQEAAASEQAAPEQTEADAAEMEAQASAEASSESEPAEAEPVVYELPLTDTPAEYSIYTTAAPGFMAAYLGASGSYNDAESTRYFAEQTGVTLKYTEIDMFSFSESFNLMIATGDYPDILTGMDSYAGGLTKALDDDVILDLTDYVKNDMPAYSSCLDAADVWKEVTNDEGQILSICSLNSECFVDRGPVMRGDWLEEQGLEAPTTYEEMHDVGLKMKNSYDISYVYFFNSQMTPSITFSAGYDLPSMDVSVTGYHFYQEDGVVKSALVDDNLKDYLKMLQTWYADGLISKDFYNAVGMEVKTAFAADECAGCWDNADFITEDNTNEELKAKGFHAVGIPVAVQEAGQVLHFKLGTDGTVQGGVCISTACEEPDLLIKTMDFSFTEAGALLSNYGIEDVSYVLDDDGTPVWAEAMTTAEDRTFRAAILPYIFSGLPTLNDVTKYWPETFDEDAYNALNLWTDTETLQDRDLPSTTYFTTDESAVYATKVTDVETYANEYLFSCITGDVDIDATWDDYVSKVWATGLQDCIDAKQGAYDRYLVR